MEDIKTELKKWLSGWADKSAYELLDFIDKNYMLSAKTDSRNAGSAVWVKGAPKEPGQYLARVPSIIEDDVVYDAVIWPTQKADYWYAAGNGFNFTVHKDKIIERLDESGQSKEGNKEEWNSERMIGRVKDRFKELEAKKFEWRSYYNGWLEGRSDMLQQVKGWGQYKPEQKENEAAASFDYKSRDWENENAQPASEEAIKRMKERWASEGKRECPDCGLWFKSEGRCPECNPLG